MKRSEDLWFQCCNKICVWEGFASETIHLKHDPEKLLCPLCNEVVEPSTWKRRSEDEIKSALVAEIDEIAGFEDDHVLVDAIAELLTLRRRMDRLELAKMLCTRKYPEVDYDSMQYSKKRVWHNEADAIIKYLEGKDGE